MNLPHSLSLFTLVAMLACSPAESQTLALDAKLPARFGNLSNVIELKDGRVVFADTKNKLFLRGDLKSGKVDTIGSRVDSLSKSGSIGEYRFPGWTAHLAGDTVALVDFSAIRTTLWSEAGRPLGVLPIKEVAGKTPVLLYDTVGHGYKIDYQAVVGGGEPGRILRPDSIPVLRLTVKDGAVDTVALLAGPEYGDATFGEQVQQAAKVFAPNDFFGVLPDGTAWIARGRENRVDWRSPDGRWTRGQTHAYSRIPVTQADKDRVLAQVREHGKQFGMPQDLRIVYPFADNKPPFDFALGRPNGEVWLQRPQSREGAALIYDVFNRKGVWEREVAFPQSSALAGFGGRGAVYGSVKNEDGTRTVARFRD
ncbi:MAG TPA: hypothetical protein VNC19_02130 [Gemmatimonadales bacterium]|nr:hypothetical protein [Gemmatimonadales bacterium]